MKLLAKTDLKNHFSDDNNVAAIREKTAAAIARKMPESLLLEVSIAIQETALGGERSRMIQYHPKHFQIVHLLELNGFTVRNIDTIDMAHATCEIMW